MKRPPSSTATIPGPAPIPLLGSTGSLLRFFRDPVRCVHDLHAQYGNVVAVSRNDASLVCAFGPQLTKQIMSEPGLFHTAAELPIRVPEASALQRLSTFLVGMNGERHDSLRRMMMPLFQKSHLVHYRDDVVAAAQMQLDSWKAGHTIDIGRAMDELSVCTALRALYGLDVSGEARELAELGKSFTEGATSVGLLLLPIDAPGLPYAQYMRLCERLEARLQALVEERKAQARPGRDVLSLLTAARDADGQPLPDGVLVGLANELFIAGHETAACTMKWTLLLLERHPQVLADLRDELDSVLHGDAPTLQQLDDQLPLLDAVIKESMRVLSVSPFNFFRRNQRPVSLDGFELPVGSAIVISPQVLHHMPELYPEPAAFRPARWMGNWQPGPYEYLPFGAGPRTCVGMGLAGMGLRVMLALIVQRFHFSLPRGTRVDYKVRGTIMGTQGALPMHVERQARQRGNPQPFTGTIRQLATLN